MNLFYQPYSTETFRGRAPNSYKAFGIRQLRLLYHSLGFIAKPEMVRILSEMVTYEVIPKNTQFITMDQHCDKAYFLLKGTVLEFTLKGDRRQITNLMTPGNIILSMNACVSNSFSEISSETCEKCHFLVLHKKDTLILTDSEYKDQISQFCTTLISRALKNQSHLANLVFLSNEEKFNLLNKYYNIIFDQFSLKNIASFIGMRPETLSRLRKSTSRKKI